MVIHGTILYNSILTNIFRTFYISPVECLCSVEWYNNHDATLVAIRNRRQSLIMRNGGNIHGLLRFLQWVF